MYESVKQMLVQDMQLDAGLISPDAELVGDLGLNSIELADLVMNCEEKYGIRIEDEDLRGLVTVGDIVSLIGRQSKEQF